MTALHHEQTRQPVSQGRAGKPWRARLPVHPACELFPPLPDDEQTALGEDIRAHGLFHPIVIIGTADGDMLIDGRSRLDAMARVGIPFDLRKVNDKWALFIAGTAYQTRHIVTADPYHYVVSVNIRRRHLTAEQRRELIAGLLKRDPGKSDLSIANNIGVSDKTVRKVRDTLEANSEIPNKPDRTEASGRKARGRKPGTASACINNDLRNNSADSAEKPRTKADRRAERERELASKQTALPEIKVGVIVADPEWRFEPWSRQTGMDRAADNHYPTSPSEIIKSRPVQDIAADDCVLFLWATVPMLDVALDVLKAWGFTYRSHMIWDKVHIGTGYWFRNRHELLLVGTKGDIPAPAMGEQFASVMTTARKEHSAKPEQFLELIEQYFPTLPKIELNRRGPARAGWHAWGNEVAPADMQETS